MSAHLIAQLRRLGKSRPTSRGEVLAALDDLVSLRTELVGARDEVAQELRRLRQNLDAAQAYGRAGKVGQNGKRVR